MPAPEQLEFARLLLTRAEEDLDALAILMEAGAADSVVGFHAQQAVEKHVKAALIAHGSDAPRTHDLRFLFQLARGADLPDLDIVSSAEWLAPWAADLRYGEPLEDPLDRARAHADAERVKDRATRLVRGAHHA